MCNKISFVEGVGRGNHDARHDRKTRAFFRRYIIHSIIHASLSFAALSRHRSVYRPFRVFVHRIHRATERERERISWRLT